MGRAEMIQAARRKRFGAAMVLLVLLAAAGCGGSGARRTAEDLENDPQNHYRWAREQHLRGYYKEALESIDKAIALDGTAYLYYNERGLIHLNAGQPEEALLDFRRVLAINPLYTDAHNNLGATLARMGQPSEARAEFQRVLEDPLYPTKEKALANLGDILFAAGDYEGAIAELRRAVAINKDYARAYSKLGRSYQALGRMDEARESFETVLKLVPLSELGREVKQVLEDMGRVD
ncbi:MAG: tetratricopeptide repeat protein [Acidobacteria bacterium]|nr:MAG: tetratricopeptide repeat protein [Acidobacteriota bacterium]